MSPHRQAQYDAYVKLSFIQRDARLIEKRIADLARQDWRGGRFEGSQEDAEMIAEWNARCA